MFSAKQDLENLLRRLQLVHHLREGPDFRVGRSGPIDQHAKAMLNCRQR